MAAFRLDVRREGRRAEPGRDPEWFSFEQARDRLSLGREEQFAAEMERVLLSARGRARS